MKELADFLSTLQYNLNSEILELFQKFYKYTLELLDERDISFSMDAFDDSEKNIEKIIEKVYEITNLAFLTIGVQKKLLNETIAILNVNHRVNLKNKPNYFEDFYKHLKNYIGFLLLVIILEYLFNMDSTKIKKLSLFDLLPNEFITKLDKFKQTYNLPPQIINGIKQDFPNLINSLKRSDFIINTEKIGAIKNLGTKPTKMMKKNHPPQSIPIAQQLPKTFLNDFGRFNPIKEEILKKFRIDKNNLLNIRVLNDDFFDLQNLFYYISILKMLNISLPFNEREILQILQKYVNEDIFCGSLDGNPDPISNFYGLSILSEFDLLNTTELINISEIQIFIESELKNFIPEKLYLNFYSLLCLTFLEQSRSLLALKTQLISPILSLDIFSNKESTNLILDIFGHLTIIKLLDETINLNRFMFYIEKLKKLLTNNVKFERSITDSARALLIFDLLDLKKIEFDICEKLLSFITESTSYFDPSNSNKYLDLKKDKIAITLELRMLFWALIATAQHSQLF